MWKEEGFWPSQKVGEWEREGLRVFFTRRDVSQDSKNLVGLLPRIRDKNLSVNHTVDTVFLHYTLAEIHRVRRHSLAQHWRRSRRSNVWMASTSLSLALSTHHYWPAHKILFSCCFQEVMSNVDRSNSLQAMLPVPKELKDPQCQGTPV